MKKEQKKLLKYYFSKQRKRSHHHVIWEESVKIRVLVQSIGNDLSVEILWRGANDLVWRHSSGAKKLIISQKKFMTVEMSLVGDGSVIFSMEMKKEIFSHMWES